METAPVILTGEPRPVPADTLPTPKPAGPLFSEVLPKCVEYAVKNSGWRGQSRAQHEATFSMFTRSVEPCPLRRTHAATYSRRGHQFS